jgi:arsenate reductase
LGRYPRVFLTQGKHIHWEFEDPAAFEGSEEEKLEKFRQIRDQVDQKIQTWLEEIDG